MERNEADKLIFAIRERNPKNQRYNAFKWYTKRGYADWCVDEALKKEREEIIKLIERMVKDNGNS